MDRIGRSSPISNLEARIEAAESLAERVLGATADGRGHTSIGHVIEELRSVTSESPEARRRLGPLIGRLESIKNSPANVTIDWIPVLEGHLAIDHRPKLKFVQRLPEYGATHVFTLLSKSEGAERLGAAVTMAGLGWIWLPLKTGDPPTDEQRPTILRAFAELRSVLANGGRVFVHCSAGIHRTGMITYAFLRHSGLAPEEAVATLEGLRPVTAHGVGQHRCDWGDSFGDQPGIGH